MTFHKNVGDLTVMTKDQYIIEVGVPVLNLNKILEIY